MHSNTNFTHWSQMLGIATFKVEGTCTTCPHWLISSAHHMLLAYITSGLARCALSPKGTPSCPAFNAPAASRGNHRP